MTVPELHSVLKSRSFKLTNYKDESYIFSFTEIHIFRDGKHVSDYEIGQRGNDFFIFFSNVQNCILTNDFKNILLVSDNVKEILNYDGLELQQKGKITTTLVGL